MSSEITLEQFRDVLPKNTRSTLTQEIVDDINTNISDPILGKVYRDNLLSYTSVMNEGRFKTTDYINAVRYVSNRMMSDSNVSAYLKTFPDKHQWFIKENTSAKDISSYVAMFVKGKLVQAIMAQTLTPFHILNQEYHQKALNVLVELMMETDIKVVSSKVRCDAANAVMTHLKPPEDTKIEISVGVKEDSKLQEIKQYMLELAALQHRNIELGITSAKEVAHSTISIIEGEFSTE